MNNKLYVGNLPYSVTNDSLREMFAAFGDITDARVITHRDSGRSKGFGFVEFATEESATKAIADMHEKEVEGRKLIVNVARPLEPRQPQQGMSSGDTGASQPSEDQPAESQPEESQPTEDQS